MEETILKATVRRDAPQKVRKAGFTPGVLNESDTTSTTVQFDTLALNKVLTRHGPNAKIWVEMDKKKRFGFIKEVQRHPVEGKVIHIAVQLLAKDQEVKMHLPVVFHGREELEHRFLQVQVHKAEIEVMGKATLMPDAVAADVSKLESGDTITAKNFNLSKEMKILDEENEIYAVIKTMKEEVVEEPEEVKPEAKAEVKPEIKSAE